jgi:hypothetical protein
MDNTLIQQEIKQEYIIKSIVYINSANHGYSHIPLSINLAMFGDNNAEKQQVCQA